jgi:hypothetical protein
MPLIVATYVCHAARLQRRTGNARTSLGPRFSDSLMETFATFSFISKLHQPSAQGHVDHLAAVALPGYWLYSFTLMSLWHWMRTRPPAAGVQEHVTGRAFHACCCWPGTLWSLKVGRTQKIYQALVVLEQAGSWKHCQREIKRLSRWRRSARLPGRRY